jgi:hypothetical protein
MTPISGLVLLRLALCCTCKESPALACCSVAVIPRRGFSSNADLQPLGVLLLALPDLNSAADGTFADTSCPAVWLLTPFLTYLDLSRSPRLTPFSCLELVCSLQLSMSVRFILFPSDPVIFHDYPTNLLFFH